MSTQQSRGGVGSTKHGKSGHATRSPRYKFMQTLEDNKKPQFKRPPLTATTIAEAVKQTRKK